MVVVATLLPYGAIVGIVDIGVVLREGRGGIGGIEGTEVLCPQELPHAGLPMIREYLCVPRWRRARSTRDALNAVETANSPAERSLTFVATAVHESIMHRRSKRLLFLVGEVTP